MRFSPIYFRFFRAAWILTVGLALAGGAGATDFPVSTVAQITTALASAAPGDTITMTNKVWTDADILFKKSGTAANPITLRAQTPGQVILDGASRLRIAGSWLVVDGLRFQSGYVPDANTEIISFRESSSSSASQATNCALINCAIIDYRGTWTNDCKWVSLYGRSNRVENCFFAGKTNLGTTLVVWLPATNATYANYHVIRRNHFGLRPELGFNGGETIRVGTSGEEFTSSRTLVEENLFQSCNGEVEIISSKSCDNLYRYNTFDSCAGTLTLRHGDRCTVEGNWFFGHGLPDTGGVRIIGEDHTVFNNYFDGLTGSGTYSALCMMNGITNSPSTGYFQVKRARVLFNTFVNCSNNFAIGVVNESTLPPIDCTNANNIVYGSAAPLVNIVTPPTNFLWEGNYFYGATVGITNSGIATNDPLLVLSSDGLWRPATNSPVLGAAAGSYTFVTNDFDGQPRTGAKDIGCDQASASAQTRRPLGPTDVGPDWIHINLSGGPSNQTVAVGSNVSFSVVTAGTPPFFYQWQKNGTNLVDGGKVSGATTNTLTVTGILRSDVADYRVVVTNTMYGVVTSTVATLTIDPATVTNDVSVTSTNVFLDDRWADGTRIDTSLPTDSAWYAYSASTLTAETNRLVGTPDALATRTWWTYFTSNSAGPVRLGTSDTLRVTLAFTPYGVNAGNTSRGLRIGLFNSSGGTRTVVDGSNPNGTNHTGYMLGMNFGQIFGGTTMKFQERTNLTSSGLVVTDTDYKELSSGGPAAGSGGFSNGVPYILQLLVKRNINSVDLTATFFCTNGGWSSLSFAGADTNDFTSAFDTFVFRPALQAQTATNFTFTQFKVELVATDNQPPVAGTFATNTAMSQSINIPVTNLLAAATDADGDAMSITAVSALSAKTGTVTLIGGNITYTPPGGYAGDDQFSYTLTDYRGASNTGYVGVTITGSTYTLTSSAGANGAVSPASTNVLAGNSASFVITASNYYRIATLKTNNADVTGVSFDNNSTTTNFIWSNVQTSGILAATFTVQVTTNDAAPVPYEWLAGYGLTNYDTDAIADQDLDGLSAWQEYIAGTDPTNAASCFKATQNTPNKVSWSAVSGRVYSVYWSTNLMNGFQPLETNILYPQGSYTNATPDPRVNNYQIKVRLQ